MNSTFWKCSNCPIGGSCKGKTVWERSMCQNKGRETGPFAGNCKGIEAKNGYWRISPNSIKNPPPCYNSFGNKRQNSGTKSKSCLIFVKCLFPKACLGAANDVLKTTDSWTNATENHREICNSALGFKNRSRLCQTCDVGYSRTWGSQCVKCGEDQDYTRLILLISFGTSFALLFYAGLVGLRIKAFVRDKSSKRRRKSIHSTMKRILLSHFQTLNSIIHLQVPWPYVLTSILDGISSMSGSFGDSVNSLECFYANQSHVDFYLYALVCVGVAPFFFVSFLAIYWYYGATNSTALGCGNKVIFTREKTKTETDEEVNTRRRLHTQPTSHFHGEEKTTIDLASRRRRMKTRTKSYVVNKNFKVTAGDALVMSSILFWFMVLPSLLRMAFVALECRSIANETGGFDSWLLLDLQQECFVGKHLSMLMISVAIIIFNLFIVPTFLILILRKVGGKQRDSNPHIMFRYGLIHSGYRTEKYWWEIMVLIRKTLIIVISTFGATDQMQLHLSLAVLVVSLHLHDTNRPFGSGNHNSTMVLDRDTDVLRPEIENDTIHERTERLDLNYNEKSLHHYEMGSLLCLLFLIWSGVLFYFDLCSEDTTICNVLIVVVLASNGGYLLVLATRCLKEWGKRNHIIDKGARLGNYIGFSKNDSFDRSHGGDQKDDEDAIEMDIVVF